MHNGSGMNNVAQSICDAERKLGLDSYMANPFVDSPAREAFLDADIHVDHTHVPEAFRKKITKPYKVVYVAHGTPEHVFHTSVEAVEIKQWGMSDSFMLMQHGLRTSDATVTFWERHAWFYKSMSDKNTKIHCFPLGVDKSFWKPQASRGKCAGEPSVFSCENCHYIKWPLDLLMLWPFVYPKVAPNPSLHVLYLPFDMHRWFFPLANRNGSAYGSHLTAVTLGAADLVNTFNSIDYQIGLVRYGDFNRVSLEANACGATSISYRGNPYADFWLTEGDQRVMADELIAILNGQVEKRKKDEVPDISVTAAAMKELYGSL
jgi:hypothetical protein